MSQSWLNGSQETKIIKEPISEIKTVPLTHDELYIEARSIGSKNGQQAANPPIHSDILEQEEVITFFLRAEVPEVLRHYHIKEELVIKKNTLTNTESISEELRSEEVNIGSIAEQEVVKDNTNNRIM